MNNQACFQFLRQKNDFLTNKNININNDHDRNDLLLLIITEKCFHINIDEIKAKCNLIVRPLNKTFQKDEDIISINCLLSVLNVLSNGKIQIFKDSDINANFDQIIINSFKQAEVPLVINQTCFDLEHRNIFLIQLEIIFQVFSEKIKIIQNSDEMDNDNNEINEKEEKWYEIDKNSSDKDEESDSDIIYVKSQEDSLLRTLNVIGKDKFHFNCFHDTIVNDSIPRFVMHLLNIESIENVHLKFKEYPLKSQRKNQEITKEELININAVLEFLKTKEIKFQILKFNFEDKLLEEDSAVLFYSNLLNFFFIKKSRREMYDRCGAILCTKVVFKEYDSYYQLAYFRTYSALLYFYINKNLDTYFKLLPNDEEEAAKLFNKAKIPKIINKNILYYGIGENFSDSVYYQLQIIFNAIDSGPKTLHIAESFLLAYYKLQRIKVPKYELIAKSIRAKRISTEFQRNRYESYRHRSNLSNSSEENFNNNNIQIERETIFPKTFRIRQQETNKIIVDNKNKEKTEFKIPESFEQYWNFVDPNFGYDNGIMYNKLEYQNNRIQLQKNWMDEMKNIQIKKIKKKEIKDENQFISIKKPNVLNESVLYNIFYYDEKNSNWKFNQHIFEQFLFDKKIQFDESLAPLVFIINSNEKESISLISNLINSNYPNFESELNDEQIFIYAICDKTLAMLNVHIDFANKIKASIKPIFLLLHVPKSKENLPNLQQIIFQIYLFLSFICDLEIVILDRNHYFHQIDLMKAINEINLSFLNTKKSLKSDENSFILDSVKKEDDDDDDDENNEYEYEYDFWPDDTNKNISTEYENKQINDKIVEKLILKQPKIIFLVNDSSNKCDKKFIIDLNDNEFFRDQLSEINDISFLHYININDYYTYNEFLSSFNKLLLNENSKISITKNNFQCIKLFELSQMYVRVRNQMKKWKNDLYDLILNRKKYFESCSKEQYSFIYISYIKNELSQIIPSIDAIFINECNKILSELKLKDNKKNRDFYSIELKQSSESQLSYLKEKINTRDFLTEEQMSLIINTHTNFLKDEFFDIISLTNVGEDNINIIYEDNIDILKSQINEDKIVFEEIFDYFIRNNKSKREIKQQYIREKMKKGANYAMREAENLNEIKVTVEIGHDLKSEIEQDF